MPGSLNKLIAALLFTTFLICGISCKKSGTGPGGASTPIEAYYASNVLNRNFIVVLATDNGTDLTSQYDGYIFVLSNTTSYYEGVLTATKAGSTFTGTWKSNDDYSKLDINLTQPSIPAEFIFLNRSWRFSSKRNFPPLFELAPWGSTDAKVLHMKRI